MNIVCKKNVASRFLALCDSSRMTKKAISEALGFHYTYISMLHKEKTFHKIGATAWERMQSAVNSGETLEVYLRKEPESSAEPCPLPSPGPDPIDIDKIVERVLVAIEERGFEFYIKLRSRRNG